MPVVGFAELREHAADLGYGLAVVTVDTLAVARGVIESSIERDAPLVLAVSGDDLATGLLPSLEAMARQAPGPVALMARQVQTADQASQAIRLGCNILELAEDAESSSVEGIKDVAVACGIDVITQAEIGDSLTDVEDELRAATLGAAAGTHASWRMLEQAVADAASQHMNAVFDGINASGRAGAAREASNPWRPVEHLIIYNTKTDDAASAELAAEGRRVLDRIPGVRATWSGQSVKADVGYRWCWLIRFAHPAVIDSYREHPDHVAYADNHFRPVAGDRVSIDYTLIGADEDA